jgi:hypothetical protein
VCSSDLQSVEISNGAVINCKYESCAKVVNKSNIQSKPHLQSLMHVTVLCARARYVCTYESKHMFLYGVLYRLKLCFVWEVLYDAFRLYSVEW